MASVLGAPKAHSGVAFDRGARDPRQRAAAIYRLLYLGDRGLAQVVPFVRFAVRFSEER